MLCLELKGFGQNIPSWFFHPSPDEYVGVSLPLSSEEVRKKSALFSALLAYCAKEEIECFRTEKSRVWENKDEVRISSLKELKIMGEIGIVEIAREYTNDYNELFVAVKIGRQTGSRFGISGSWESEQEESEKSVQYKGKGEVQFFYTDLTNGEVAFIYDCEDENEERYIRVTAKDSNTVFDSKEVVSTYEYPGKKNAKRNNEFFVCFSCEKSLGLAYLQGMLDLIVEQKEGREKKPEGMVGEVVMKKLNYSMAVGNNNLMFTIY